ncbi:MAG: TIGR02186 family protein [Alphaproteobacteria bacterium]|nr:TIGR02186 family protein [Alphaproteobacteria bacterium]
MRILLIIAVLIVLPLSAVRAADDVIAVDLAVDHVDITTGFTGSYLSLFGVQDEPGDIAITIKGPAREMVVRRKENVFGIWMNRTNMVFESVPAFYDYALSTDEAKIGPDALRREYTIGVETLKFRPRDEGEDAALVQEFQNALIRNEQAQGLFPTEPEPITYIDDKFFRTTIYIPSNVPTGLYTIETYLIRGGRVVDMRETEVKVAQVGKSAAINSFSKSWSFIYGLMCVAFAMGVGWFSNALRRKLS